MRMIFAQLFGEACRNPGTVGWLSAAAPLCVTRDGTTTQQGGIVFADLPSNLLGSFLMGLFQDSTVLGLAVPMAVAWLGPHHSFQNAKILHTAFKTGFCGSLTTFSSWNSEMIVMIFGTDRSRDSQLWSAFFGYIIGMETSLGSFACGCSLARRLHRTVNPVLAAEMDASREKIAQGVYINSDLPDFERRFLPDLRMENIPGTAELHHTDRMDALVRWRSSTVDVRRVGNPGLPALVEVENALLVLKRRIPPEAESIARANGWEVDALIDYVSNKERDFGHLPSVASSTSLGAAKHPIHDPHHEPRYLMLPVAGMSFAMVVLVLLLGLVLINDQTATSVTNRTMVYGMLFAPSGALLRWKLSGWNGNAICLPAEWRWLPAGTYVANVFGSAVSIAAVAIEYRFNTGYTNLDVTNFWLVGTIRAIKVGFAGSLTTVSTFVAEVSSFMHGQTDHAYPYILVTLCSSSCIGSMLYALIVFAL